MELGINVPEMEKTTKEIRPKFKPAFVMIMSPEHFKAYVKMVNNNLELYEKQYGKINKLPEKKKK